MSSTVRFATLALCLLFAVSNAVAQDYENERWENGVVEAWSFNSDKYTKLQAAAARERWQLIESTVKASRDNWAGDYQIGVVSDVRMWILRWSPESGFVYFNINACAANVDEVEYGKVSATPTHVEISSNRTADAATPSRARKLVKVKWGERRYLVEENNVADFCNQITGVGNNLFDEISAFLHNDDRDKPSAELPTLPQEYQRFIRKPIDAMIIKVASSYIKPGEEDDWSNELITPVTINVGSMSGVKRGMSLSVLGSGHSEEVKVTRVYRTTSRGVIVRSVRKQPGVKLNEWDDGYDAEQPLISVGWQLTTSLHKQIQDLEEHNRSNPESVSKP